MIIHSPNPEIENKETVAWDTRRVIDVTFNIITSSRTCTDRRATEHNQDYYYEGLKLV